MSNKFLKIAKETIAPFLCDIFNCSIESKIYSHDFKIAIVTPIFKVRLMILEIIAQSLFFLLSLVFSKKYCIISYMII